MIIGPTHDGDAHADNNARTHRDRAHQSLALTGMKKIATYLPSKECFFSKFHFDEMKKLQAQFSTTWMGGIVPENVSLRQFRE